ncbi:proline-rich protein HaeIII subfamily 1-like [Peromyscus leucopus]|uniref:proline-rich protein HaeIII subfamily 1-like n=1 Tax=Peromyscus leucopus TaxID=10041 RepID=UPI00188534AF|nr:proline-rich protein HaeIII subfamily 1-like [Peromyscus leucopus]
MENPERKQEEEMGHGAVSRLPPPLRTPDKQPAAAAPTPALLPAPDPASPPPAGAPRSRPAKGAWPLLTMRCEDPTTFQPPRPRPPGPAPPAGPPPPRSSRPHPLPNYLKGRSSGSAFPVRCQGVGVSGLRTPGSGSVVPPSETGANGEASQPASQPGRPGFESVTVSRIDMFILQKQQQQRGLERTRGTFAPCVDAKCPSVFFCPGVQWLSQKCM